VFESCPTCVLSPARVHLLVTWSLGRARVLVLLPSLAPNVAMATRCPGGCPGLVQSVPRLVSRCPGCRRAFPSESARVPGVFPLAMRTLFSQPNLL
jgi:hypothetical protein